jgi:endogenous inhibitor of DNA gyrase (YacG/DUF329 family)
MSANRFAHVLLFACPECNLPVSISRVSHERNLEAVDAKTLKVWCPYCNTSSDMPVVTAKKHFVEPWQ